MKCLFEIGYGLFSLINVLYTAESTGEPGRGSDVLILALCHITRQKQWNVSKITGIYSLLEFRFESSKSPE